MTAIDLDILDGLRRNDQGMESSKLSRPARAAGGTPCYTP